MVVRRGVTMAAALLLSSVLFPVSYKHHFHRKTKREGA